MYFLWELQGHNSNNDEKRNSNKKYIFNYIIGIARIEREQVVAPVNLLLYLVRSYSDSQLKYENVQILTLRFYLIPNLLSTKMSQNIKTQQNTTPPHISSSPVPITHTHHTQHPPVSCILYEIMHSNILGSSLVD